MADLPPSAEPGYWKDPSRIEIICADAGGQALRTRHRARGAAAAPLAQQMDGSRAAADAACLPAPCGF